MSAVEAEDSGGSVTDADVKDPASKPRISYRFWVPVAVLAVAGFGVRLYSVLRWYQHLPLALDDNYYYHYQARLLADGRGFINPFYLRQQHIVAPSAAHPPMYSLYLAAWTLVGVGGVLDHRVVTCLAGATLCIPMAMLGRRLGGRWAGWIAAAFGEFFPPLWINDGLLLSETVAAIAVAWAMVATSSPFGTASSASARDSRSKPKAPSEIAMDTSRPASGSSQYQGLKISTTPTIPSTVPMISQSLMTPGRSRPARPPSPRG